MPQWLWASSVVTSIATIALVAIIKLYVMFSINYLSTMPSSLIILRSINPLFKLLNSFHEGLELAVHFCHHLFQVIHSS